MKQGDQEALRHPKQPQQAQPRLVQEVPVILIKNWHDTCLYAIFQRQIDLKQSQSYTGYQDALGHPQRPRQTQLRRVQQVPVMIIKIWHGTCINNKLHLLNFKWLSLTRSLRVSGSLLITLYNWYLLYSPWLSLSRSLTLLHVKKIEIK